MARTINNIICISDLHSGCKLALCPPEGAALDDGGRYMPSSIQRRLWTMWQHFWRDWVPVVTKGEPYCVVMNGDVIDGVHHNSTTQISHNLEDQAEIAYRLLAPIVDKCKGRFYMVRGTEAHVGKSGVEEERLAKRLGAIPNDAGQHARYDLWKRCGKGLVHFLHHIGTTSSSAHESSAINAELVAEFNEACRWGEQRPDVIVRSHRHRCAEVRIPTDSGFATACVTPAWQTKTPFAWKVAGARLSPPQIGGVLIRQGDRALFTDPKVWHLKRGKVE